MSQFRPTYPVLRWTLVVAGMLAVAWAAIVAIGRLQTEATGARDSQFELVSLRLDLAHIQQVPWGAAPDEGDELDSVRGELQGDQQDIEADLARLSRNGGLPNRSRVVAPFKRTMVALWQILDLVSKGRSDQTNKASSIAAHQAAVADQALQRAARRNRGRSVSALRQSRIGSAAVILLLFCAFAWFYGRAIRARRLAEGLATDNHRLLAASQREALTDQLTGLGSRRALMTDMASLPAPGEGEQTLVALLDLDGSSNTTTPSATQRATRCWSCWDTDSRMRWRAAATRTAWVGTSSALSQQWTRAPPRSRPPWPPRPFRRPA